MTLALNEYDVDSFSQICNKGILYLKKQQKEYAIKNCKYKHISIYDAVDNQMKYLKEDQRYRAGNFSFVMKKMAKSQTSEAISVLMDYGYGGYLKEKELDDGKVEILKILAKQEPDIQSFLNRLSELERLISGGFSSKDSGAVILSTIHSSKGKEYDSVYMLDVYDGRFPASKSDMFNRSKDSSNWEMEERRLFYVGITRAKNKLTLFSLKDRKSSFVDELSPKEEDVESLGTYAEQKLGKSNGTVSESGYKHAEDVLYETQPRGTLIQKIQRESMERNRQRAQRKEEERRKKELEACQNKEAEQKKKEIEEWQQKEAERLKKLEEERLERELEAAMDYQRRYDEVKSLFIQQDTPIFDSFGERWVQCEKCGAIKPISQFWKTVGPGNVNNEPCNLGRCNNC